VGLYAEGRLCSRDRFSDIEPAGLSQLSCRLSSIQCVLVYEEARTKEYIIYSIVSGKRSKYSVILSVVKNNRFDCLTYSVFLTMSRSNDNRARARGGTVRSRGRGQAGRLRRRGGGWAFSGEQNLTMSGRQQMELMPSVSRSSGLDKDGDSCVFFASLVPVIVHMK